MIPNRLVFLEATTPAGLVLVRLSLWHLVWRTCLYGNQSDGMYSSVEGWRLFLVVLGFRVEIERPEEVEG